jgi:urea carboxylase
MLLMFRKVLIANRGAIACRIIRTLKRLGITSVAVYSDVDRHSLHVIQADEAINIGPAPANQSYLSIQAILNAAKRSGAEAIHPGYGFLSERPDFADACDEVGISFIGPTGDQMRTFAVKHTAREVASSLGLPLLPGTGILTDVTEANEAARSVGFPLMLKSTAGGGGIGIRLCRNSEELYAEFESVQNLGQNNFGDGGAFLERYVEQARHIEVQIFGDGTGNVISLGERDCSAQRRNQKVIEETPALGISGETRLRLYDAAVKIGRAVDYRSAGTVEFVYDNQTQEFYFLEVNTRLQVEHGVTEEVYGIDIVDWMVRQASNDLPPLSDLPQNKSGHSIEVRIYAEDPGKNFQPSSGRLTKVDLPSGIRVETWVAPGTEITPYYDPMIAKLIVHETDRHLAINSMNHALAATQLYGIETNVDYLKKVCASDTFSAGSITTSFLSGFHYHRMVIDVISGGTQTTVQDFPGRVGYWNVGVPPSGPMDSLAFRLANRLLGNDGSAAAIEITLLGPTLKFGCDTLIALTGADIQATLDGERVEQWKAVVAKAGSLFESGSTRSTGLRAYLAVAGGLDVGLYLGSGATFMLGRFGGHDGRSLRAGDVVHLKDPKFAATESMCQISRDVIPKYGNSWDIGVLYGPHGAPDFFLDDDITMLFDTEWRVHHQSDRTGVRLLGPKPQWARLDGGEAGLHPSNIHDNAYAIGTIDFTGDMPIILGQDGPSLGGFVCPATIVDAELWKVGQLRPGDTVRFQALTYAQSVAMSEQLDESIRTLSAPLPLLPVDAGRPTEPAIVSIRPATLSTPATITRADGDRYLLIEFGPNILDLSLRLRVHALEAQVRSFNLPGIVDITAGVRSLHIHYNPSKLPREGLLEALIAAEATIPVDLDITVPSRIVHLPLSWNDPQARLAAEKYMQAVRPDAPWCPDNIEFIRRINGLSSTEDVYKIVFDASYLVLGLGDVYLGAPVATPTDPRHRLVTTKYNPARTWTPENAVGIGGAYMCIYGMEGPGGYQLFGRTTQVWNTFKSTKDFEPGTPWLLRSFDQIKFYPVNAEELLDMRDGFLYGDYELDIRETEFRFGDYQNYLESIKDDATACRNRQQAAFAEERARWAAAGQALLSGDDDFENRVLETADVPAGCEEVVSPMASSVWKILIEPGRSINIGDSLVVLSAMKTETVVTSPFKGTVVEVRTRPDALVQHGQSLVIVRVDG